MFNMTIFRKDEVHFMGNLEQNGFDKLAAFKLINNFDNKWVLFKKSKV